VVNTRPRSGSGAGEQLDIVLTPMLYGDDAYKSGDGPEAA